MEWNEYNGWENKLTWLMHLHLSNEAGLMQEIAMLVAGEPNDGPAGRLVEMWVKLALTNWSTGFARRNRVHDESLRLLVWDLVSTALGSVTWEKLVALLAGEVVAHNDLFLWSLYRCILNDSSLFQPLQVVLAQPVSISVAADALREWFRLQVDAWMDLSMRHRLRHQPIAMLVYSLLQNAYALVNWEHVARAFRSGY